MNIMSNVHRHRKSLFVGLRIICVAVIFWLISMKIRLPNFQEFGSPFFIIALAIATLLNILQSVVCTLRWNLIARTSFSHPKFSKSLWAYLEGAFFNQALPSFVGGDAVRIMRWHENGVPTGIAALTVLLDRVFGALGAAALALAACLLLRGTPVERYKILLTALLALSVIVLGTATLFLFRWPLFRNLFANVARLQPLLDVLAKWRPGTRRMAILVALGVTGQVLGGVAVYLLAHALHISVPASLLISITGIILLLSMIPLSLAGWGVREAGFVALLVPLGIDGSAGFALGVAFGLSALLGALPGGLSLLFGLAYPRAAS
jgi:hypothetical protein